MLDAMKMKERRNDGRRGRGKDDNDDSDDEDDDDYEVDEQEDRMELSGVYWDTNGQSYRARIRNMSGGKFKPADWTLRGPSRASDNDDNVTRSSGMPSSGMDDEDSCPAALHAAFHKAAAFKGLKAHIITSDSKAFLVLAGPFRAGGGGKYYVQAEVRRQRGSWDLRGLRLKVERARKRAGQPPDMRRNHYVNIQGFRVLEGGRGHQQLPEIAMPPQIDDGGPPASKDGQTRSRQPPSSSEDENQLLATRPSARGTMHKAHNEVQLLKEEEKETQCETAGGKRQRKADESTGTCDVDWLLFKMLRQYRCVHFIF
ncbi:unnamed protein product [Vitrella brassicaformis CCMP3155]|uniref:Uncharacterized protein n=1 Tax=Vitrella brassicaformis (strain CCMP3155) TaxID=1169540 RepID=A0A0G4EWN4_VITBC|nr:unnamed protein product [Vitrella brassicaformis CCMP3155]|eukprot:CEM03030.1 unnamed protein product [Vitrella brassicaformis CCMP3155]